MVVFGTEIAMWRLLIAVFASALLVGCTSPFTPNYAPQAVAPHGQSQAVATVPYPPGEYLASMPTPVGATADSFILMIKAADRNDLKSVRILHQEGLVFNLPKGTRIILTPANVDGAQLATSVAGTVDNIKICTGTVESGEYIGTPVAIGCEALER